jgi:hypothetical protein
MISKDKQGGLNGNFLLDNPGINLETLGVGPQQNTGINRKNT